MAKKKHTPKKNLTRKKVLHVGCGLPDKNRLHQSFHNDQEWEEVRLDINPEVTPDIIADITDMKNVPENGFDALYSSHNLEHLYAHQVAVALKEFYRVLRNNGHVLLTMPNIQQVGYYIASGKLESTIYTSPAGPITALDIMYGMGTHIAAGNTYMAHKTAFTAETLGRKLKNAGFRNVRVQRDGLNLWARGDKITAKNAKADDRIHIQDVPQPKGAPTPPAPEPVGWPDVLDRGPVQWKPLGLNKPRKAS